MPRGASIDFSDRVLAEAVRAAEHDGLEPIVDAAAEFEAAAIEGVFEERLAHRARRLEVAGPLTTAFRQLRRATAAIVVLAAGAALLAGASVVRASLGTPGEEPANIFLILVGALGVQSIALLAWLVLVTVRPSALGGGSVGGLLVGLGGRLSAWLHRGPAQLAALRGIGTVLATSRVGSWSLSIVSHLVWVAFNAGVLTVLILMLSTRQYTFAWQTTILSDRTYVPVTRALAAGPRMLGFVVPTEPQIRQSRYTGDDDLRPQATTPDGRETAWSGLIVGAVVTYGLLPRLALVVLTAVLAGRARRRYRLDVDRPGFRRLRGVLDPGRRHLGRVDDDDDGEITAEHDLGADATAPRAHPAGPPAVVGFEIERPAGAWPPAVSGMSWDDLGFVDDRPDRDRVIATLRDGPNEPAMLVVVCGLTITPDRGVERFLGAVQQSISRPVRVVLSEGDRLRHRGHLPERIADWKTAAARAGIDAANVLEIDLDNATNASLAQLAASLDSPCHGQAPIAHAPRDAHLTAAFTLIADRVTRWPPRPEPKEQAELHQAIAKLYRDAPPRWREMLEAPESLDDFAVRVKGGAARAVGLLPPSLRLSPRWLTAGALSGALGCVAAATLISPVAIGALPVWAGLGAVVLQVVRSAMPHADVDDTAERPDLADRETAVRSITLFTLLLELQGERETTISRLLEAALPDANDAGPGEDVRAWLEEVKHRLDIARATGAAS